MKAGASIVHFLSFTSGSPFTYSCLLFPIDVSEWVKFETIWETVGACSQGGKLVFSTMAQASCPKFGF